MKCYHMTFNYIPAIVWKLGVGVCLSNHKERRLTSNLDIVAYGTKLTWTSDLPEELSVVLICDNWVDKAFWRFSSNSIKIYINCEV